VVEKMQLFDRRIREQIRQDVGSLFVTDGM